VPRLSANFFSFTPPRPALSTRRSAATTHRTAAEHRACAAAVPANVGLFRSPLAAFAWPAAGCGGVLAARRGKPLGGLPSGGAGRPGPALGRERLPTRLRPRYSLAMPLRPASSRPASRPKRRSRRPAALGCTRSSTTASASSPAGTATACGCTAAPATPYRPLLADRGGAGPAARALGDHRRRGGVLRRRRRAELRPHPLPTARRLCVSLCLRSHRTEWRRSAARAAGDPQGDAGVLAEAGGRRLAFQEHLAAEGPSVFAHACKMGLDGIVSKRRDSWYRSGRSKDWLKSKNPDCVAVRREAEEDWGR
jgi:hypothetical protein